MRDEQEEGTKRVWARETKSRRLKRKSENGRVTGNEELRKEGPEPVKFSVVGRVRRARALMILRRTRGQ